MQSRNEKVGLLSFFWMFAIVIYHAGEESSHLYKELLSDFRIGGVSYFYLVSGYGKARLTATPPPNVNGTYFIRVKIK